MKRSIALLLGVLAIQPAVAAEKNPNHWLRNAPDDASRFELLEDQAGGFSGAMYEVGERYRSVHEAVQRGNKDLALYHWDKIRSAIRTGYQRRPGRQANADAMFLNSGVWADTRAALASGDSKQAMQQLSKARDVCMACHVAERVPFINQQSLFELPMQ